MCSALVYASFSPIGPPLCLRLQDWKSLPDMRIPAVRTTGGIHQVLCRIMSAQQYKVKFYQRVGPQCLRLLSNATRFSRRGCASSLFTSVQKKRMCTTSYWPRYSCGNGLNASCVVRCMFFAHQPSLGKK